MSTAQAPSLRAAPGKVPPAGIEPRLATPRWMREPCPEAPAWPWDPPSGPPAPRREPFLRFPSGPTLAAGLLILLAPAAFANPPAARPAGAKAPASHEDLQVPKPPFSEGIFPCTSCHGGKSQKVDTRRRELTDMHGDIVLAHGPASRWCLDCHDPLDRDQLRLASGERVSFTASHELCGQCHGDKHRDWRVGVHGKRTGSWNGTKQYLLCVHCHDPHGPRFKPVKPAAPPARPEQIHPRKEGVQ